MVTVVVGRRGERGQREEPELDLGILAGRLLFSFQNELFEALAAQGHSRLRPRHGAVLAYLDEEGSRASDLSRRSGQHKQVIGNLIDELEELGYVQRRPDPLDRRAKLVVPTPLGRDQMAKGHAIAAGIEERHAQALGEKEYAQFKVALEAVVRRQQAWRDGAVPEGGGV